MIDKVDEFSYDWGMTKLTEASPGRVFVVAVIDPVTQEIGDLEILAGFPLWNLTQNHQIVFVGSINGGDSVKVIACDAEECMTPATEFAEFNDDEGANLCEEHMHIWQHRPAHIQWKD